MHRSYLERIALALIKEAGLPDPIEEYRFHPTRKWRCDFLWPDHRLMLEVEGMVFQKRGRHTSGAGYTADCEKYNEAVLMGYRVIRVTKAHMISGQMVEWLKRVLLV